MRVCAVCASVFALGATVATGTNAPRRCVRPQNLALASETGPQGSRWNVAASIANISGCKAWLLGFEFRPLGIRKGSWRGAWAIPPGGHLSKDFEVGARDERAGSARAVSGVVGGDVRSVEVITGRGTRFVVHPRRPSAALRRTDVWLRNVRYFLRFYSKKSPAQKLLLRDRAGRAVASVHGAEGEFVRF